jgi:uroporphyrinogen-III synthase
LPGEDAAVTEPVPAAAAARFPARMRTVLVTRPIDQARPWVEALAGRGWPAAAVPLLGIESTGDPEPVLAAWARLAEGRYAAAMFVSPNAVERFMALSPAAGVPAVRWPAHTLAAATGPGTARALAAAGVPGGVIVQPPADAAAFDSEHLWPLLADRSWQGRSVLIVRGDGGRDWLARQWQAAGAQVERIEAYRRGEPAWSVDEAAAVTAACREPTRHAWLFSSSQGIGVLMQRAPAASIVPALATHPAIARSAREQGFARVIETGPTLDDVVRCLKSSFAEA